MAHERIKLTPAQTEFLTKSISLFGPDTFTLAAAGRAGSDRKFIRIRSRKTKESYIVIIWDSSDHDWNRFISIQRDVSQYCPFLPKIFASDDGHGLILEEDLGAVTLKKYCTSAAAASVEAVYKKVLDALARWQQLRPEVSAVIASRDMDSEMFLWESEYFSVHCVREYFGLDRCISSEWEKERVQIAAEAAAFPKVCIHRDFQSENIMLYNKKVRFVDFQGARRGPAGYDVASLLYDPYVPSLTPALASRLFSYYRSVSSMDATPHSLRICAVQRLMQALGAYGNLSIHKGKEWYSAYIPIALRRLKGIIAGCSEVPVLKIIVDECLGIARRGRQG